MKNRNYNSQSWPDRVSNPGYVDLNSPDPMRNTREGDPFDDVQRSLSLDLWLPRLRKEAKLNVIHKLLELNKNDYQEALTSEKNVDVDLKVTGLHKQLFCKELKHSADSFGSMGSAE
ncbi:hypothetical protein CAPTEDRAFT_199008 [Capitella teleta]|uniref:Uncharacterized protein n=1 Tax=Capitella teleta TaxID=283909 RepID=R7TPF9_CAPTE|nr:hypothetical protein CAPTEDRAFT_199008 [Capitella teleta]|eukprot:ELT95773.1 hypothetical protein CAPTEDRAFT_199008 [Capitella teleta]